MDDPLLLDYGMNKVDITMSSVVRLLQDLVRIPSVSSLSNRPMVEYANRFLHEAGWQTCSLPYRDTSGTEKINLLAVPPGQDLSNPTIDLAFICHTDTVPYNASWEQATQPVVRDGILYGCGACDVKGFLACLLTAISEVDPANFNRTVCLTLTADEEVGCIGASKLIASQAIAPKHVVIGEPTSLRPGRAGKGYCLAEIRVLGKEAHSAHPAEGASAIYRAARFITKIEEFAEQLRAESHDFFDPPFTTVNIGTIKGGTAKNIVPGECAFLLEWRPIPGEDTRFFPQAVIEIAETLRDVDPDFDYKVEVRRNQPGFDAGANSSLVRLLETLTGRRSIAIPFGTEASLFSQIAEEVVVFGPGDMRTAHSSRESVATAELDECVVCLKKLMRSHSTI